MKHLRTRALLTAATASVLLAACAGTSPGDAVHGKVTTTAQAARDRAEQLLDTTTQGVSPALQWQDSWPDVVVNQGGVNDAPDGSAMLKISRRIGTTVASDRQASFVQQVQSSWKLAGLTLYTLPFDSATGIGAKDRTGNYVTVTVFKSSGRVEIEAHAGTIASTGANPLGSPSPLPTHGTAAGAAYWSH